MVMSESAPMLAAANALEELDRIAPGVPLLALGQTVFWDEPMKAGLALALRKSGSDRELIAGVHDTDYFAKLPSGRKVKGRFRSFPHNDTTTKGLWSAAGEFSTLFGSETVVTRERLMKAGLRFERLTQVRSTMLDEATEAWGWRGIVSLDDQTPVTAEVPVRQVLPELLATLNWALDSTLQMIAGSNRDTAQMLADELRGLVCDAADETQTLSELYERIVPDVYRFCSNTGIDVQTERTTRLLRFNSATVDQPRFELASLFVDSATRDAARKAYDDAVQGSGIFSLSRFGTGAIPFDLYIPGIGRGTVRIGTRGVVINTPKPQFLTTKTPLRSLSDLAAAVETKFGPDCVLVGKAVALIGMLAKEFVFVFHEGASAYVSRSRNLHRLLNERLQANLSLNPILRIRYHTWDALRVCCSWLRLPEPLRGPFAAEELCAPSIAQRWHGVAETQEGLLNKLGQLRQPVALIDFLDESVGGQWRVLAEEYRSLHEKLQDFLGELVAIQDERHRLHDRRRNLRRTRVAAELAMGEHFRAKILNQEPTEAELAERARLSGEVQRLIGEIDEVKQQWHDVERRQRDLTHGAEVMDIRERRRSIEIEAELRRLMLIREAVISSQGLARASLRPSAWWFRLVCPDGLWFRETVESGDYYIEPLI